MQDLAPAVQVMEGDDEAKLIVGRRSETVYEIRGWSIPTQHKHDPIQSNDGQTSVVMLPHQSLLLVVIGYICRKLAAAISLNTLNHAVRH